MDLGCIDLGCVENPSRETASGKENSPKECSSANKFGKNDRAKDALRSSLTALNKLTSQICKPPYRKTSPINWFPRKKTEPYLKRKIKMLQEVDGMCSTLDEALGDSNPHYSRVLREKIAIKEAAKKAVECRKAAMVEASWCRILKAARIETKEAEANLLKAEADAAEALEVAREAGVIMNDIPLDSARNHSKVETTSAISATFETGFEVDKQVAAAVKAAFIKLASCPSISKDEFKELLRKISENPDTDENCLFSDPTAEIVSGAGPDEKKPKKKLESSSKFDMDSIIDMMLERLHGLKEEELASLATIVATSGLNAALSEMGTDDDNRQEENGDAMMPLGGRMTRKNTNISTRQTNTTEAELPSLDKFLVKRLTRLEREVLEVKNGREKEAGIGNKRRLDDDNFPFGGNKSPRIEVVENVATMVSDLGVSQAKRHSPELKEEEVQKKKGITTAEASSDLPSLDKFLVKHVTRLEREILEAKSRRDNNNTSEEVDSVDHPKENPMRGVGKNKEELPSSYESLDKVLVKHISRLEREKLELNATALLELEPKKKGRRDNNTEEGGLDQILVKRNSKLEQEKNAADDDGSSRKHFVSRRETREKDLLQAAWGGLSLGNSMRPHVSRLERDKADWLRAEEEERKKNNHE